MAIGGSLPRLLLETRKLVEVSVSLRQKAFPLVPPYASEENRRWLLELFPALDAQNLFDPKKLLDWACLGGAAPDFAKFQISRLLGWLEDIRRSVANHTYVTAGGGLMYIVSARKRG